MLIRDPEKWRGRYVPPWLKGGAEVDPSHFAAASLRLAVIFPPSGPVDVGPYRTPLRQAAHTLHRNPMVGTREGPMRRGDYLLQTPTSPATLIAHHLKPTQVSAYMLFHAPTTGVIADFRWLFGVLYNDPTSTPYTSWGFDSGAGSTRQIRFCSNWGAGSRQTYAGTFNGYTAGAVNDVFGSRRPGAVGNIWLNGRWEDSDSVSQPDAILYSSSSYLVVGGFSFDNTGHALGLAIMWGRAFANGSAPEGADFYGEFRKEPWGLFRPITPRLYAFYASEVGTAADPTPDTSEGTPPSSTWGTLTGTAVDVSTQVIVYCVAGIARSGATRLGYYPLRTRITIGGVSVNAELIKPSLKVSEAIDEQPSTAEFVLKLNHPDINLPVGLEFRAVTIVLGGTREYQFSGRVVNSQLIIPRKAQTHPRLKVSCLDHMWEFDFNPVAADASASLPGVWTSLSATSVLKDLVDHYLGTSPRFSYGGSTVEAGLPVVDFTLQRKERPSSAVSRLMKLVGGYWFLAPDRRLWAYLTAPSITPAAPLMDTSSVNFWDVTVDTDASQMRSRVAVFGRTVQVRSAYIPGADEILVDDISGLEVGSLVSGVTVIGDGRDVGLVHAESTVDGPLLTVLEGLPNSLPAGAALQLRVFRTSDSAQSILAERAPEAVVGTGVVTGDIEDGALGVDSAAFVGDGELAVFGQLDKVIRYQTRDRYARKGALVVASLVVGSQTVAGSFIIQRVEIDGLRDGAGTNPALRPVRKVTAGTFTRNLYDLLTRLRTRT